MASHVLQTYNVGSISIYVRLNAQSNIDVTFSRLERGTMIRNWTGNQIRKQLFVYLLWDCCSNSFWSGWVTAMELVGEEVGFDEVVGPAWQNPQELSLPTESEIGVFPDVLVGLCKQPLLRRTHFARQEGYSLVVGKDLRTAKSLFQGPKSIPANQTQNEYRIVECRVCSPYDC